MKKNTLYAFFGFICLGIALYLHFHPSLPLASSSSQSTQSVLGSTTSHVGAASEYPDPSKTPGEIFPTATKAQICVSGYTKTVRNVPTSEKKQVMEAYGLTYPQAKGAYEVDHFIPLEIGGSNDIKNLWPEPANPTPGFHQKDVVENYLHAEVCNGKETLSQAQSEIQTDWYAVYQKIPNKGAYQF